MKKFVVTFTLAIVLVLGFTAPTYASIDLLGGSDTSSSSSTDAQTKPTDICDQIGTSNGPAVCNDRSKNGGQGQPLTGPNGLIPKITRLVAIVAGAAAIIVILLSSLRYITASGDPKNIESAKNTLIGAVIGLIVIVLAQSIIVYVTVKLGS